MWKGYEVLWPTYERCLVSLSRGGSDATVTREFDLKAKSFVTNGFYLPEAKASVTRTPLVYFEHMQHPQNQFYFWQTYTNRVGENAIFMREIDRDSSRWDSEAGIQQGRTHSLATFLDRARRKTDGRPVRQPIRRVYLDDDVVGIDAEDGGGADRGEHA